MKAKWDFQCASQFVYRCAGFAFGWDVLDIPTSINEIRAIFFCMTFNNSLQIRRANELGNGLNVMQNSWQIIKDYCTVYVYERNEIRRVIDTVFLSQKHQKTSLCDDFIFGSLIFFFRFHVASIYDLTWHCA